MRFGLFNIEICKCVWIHEIYIEWTQYLDLYTIIQYIHNSTCMYCKYWPKSYLKSNLVSQVNMIAGHWPIYPLPSPSFDLKISCLKLIVAFILHIGFHLKWERKKGNLPYKFFFSGLKQNILKIYWIPQCPNWKEHVAVDQKANDFKGQQYPEENGADDEEDVEDKYHHLEDDPRHEQTGSFLSQPIKKMEIKCSTNDFGGKLHPP